MRPLLVTLLIAAAAGPLAACGSAHEALYGPGQPAQNVQVDAKEFSRLPTGAYSHMIELAYPDQGPTNAVARRPRDSRGA